ncbi:UBA domain-containing protein [Streptomyces flaveolus]|uniref:hypothetical protein n=1 Tax=Streptomyces flaveolus TaxID=67297 RepID=UPI0037F4A0F4
MNDHEDIAEPEDESRHDNFTSEGIAAITGRLDVSRERAIKALRASNGDVVNAMTLLSR